MKKVIMDISDALLGNVVTAFLPLLPPDTIVESTCKLKFVGEWLPDEFETPEGQFIRHVTPDEMRAIIGGLK